MKFIFVITCYEGVNTGKGGHYYSARTLAETLADSFELLAVGHFFPSAWRGAAIPVRFVEARSLVAAARECLRVGLESGPTHVHCFDVKAYFFGQIIGMRSPVQVSYYLTKPGGADPGVLYPSPPNLVCFSQENFAAVRRRFWVKSERVHLIPQRVAAPAQNRGRVDDLSRFTSGRVVVLRIGRIGRYYRLSLKQTLGLVRSLRDEGMDAVAVIIGVVEDEAIRAEVASELAAGDLLLTEDKYTMAASELIGLADAVVGTGRTLVEAALCKKVLFVPIAGAELPTLVTPENWQQLAFYNFSERSKLPVVSTMREAVEAIRGGNTVAAEEISGELGLDAAVDAYRGLYTLGSLRSVSMWDRLVATLAVVRSTIRARLSAGSRS